MMGGMDRLVVIKFHIPGWEILALDNNDIAEVLPLE